MFNIAQRSSHNTARVVLILAENGCWGYLRNKGRGLQFLIPIHSSDTLLYFTVELAIWLIAVAHCDTLCALLKCKYHTEIECTLSYHCFNVGWFIDTFLQGPAVRNKVSLLVNMQDPDFWFSCSSLEKLTPVGDSAEGKHRQHCDRQWTESKSSHACRFCLKNPKEPKWPVQNMSRDY